MKKLAAVLCIAVLIVIFLLNISKPYDNNPESIKISDNVSRINVRNGSNGNITVLHDVNEIQFVIDQINMYELKRGKELSPHSGWLIALDIFTSDGEVPMSFVLRDNGVEYNNYFYGTNVETETLFTFLTEKVE